MVLVALLWVSLGAAQAQNWEWATPTTRISFGSAYVTQAVPDVQGNVYVTGYFRDAVNFGIHPLVASRASTGYQDNFDLFVAKLTAGGQWEWAVQAGGGTQGQAKGVGLALEPDGQGVYVTGLAVGTTSFGALVLANSAGANNNGFVARLSQSGHWQWVVRAGNCGRPALDGTGKIYVAGAFSGSTLTFGPTTLVAPVNDSNIFVAWLNASGQWLGAVSGGGAGFENATSLAVDGYGNAYVGGTFSNFSGTTTTFDTIALHPVASGVSDGYVAKLDSTRHWQWAVRGGPFDSNAEPPKVAVSIDGRLISWGGTVSEASFGPYHLSRFARTTSGAAIASLSRRGSWQWVASSIPAGTGTARTTDVTADAQGNWYAVGMAGGANSFGPWPITNSGIDQVWAARLNGTTGAWQWVAPAGGIGNSVATSAAVEGMHLYVGGYFTQSVRFSPFQLSTLNTFGSEAYVARSGTAVLATRSASVANSLALYPNPARGGAFTLYLPAHFTTSPIIEVTILDALGKQVYHAPLLSLAPDGSLTANIAAPMLSAGLYLLRIQASDGAVITHRLVIN